MWQTGLFLRLIPATQLLLKCPDTLSGGSEILPIINGWFGLMLRRLLQPVKGLRYIRIHGIVIIFAEGILFFCPAAKVSKWIACYLYFASSSPLPRLYCACSIVFGATIPLTRCPAAISPLYPYILLVITL